MSEINSPLGRRAMAMRQQVLTVPNEAEPQAPVQERQITSFGMPKQIVLDDVNKIRQEKIAAQNRISPEAKKRTEFLLGLGNVFKDVPIGGVIFTIRSLNVTETKQVVRKTASEASNIDAFYVGREQVLARAICKIDGNDVYTVLGDDSVETMLAWIDEMQESVIIKLHDAYLDMINENKRNLTISGEEEAKEVVEDIKK